MNFGRNFARFGDFGHVRNFLTNEIQNPGCDRPWRPDRQEDKNEAWKHDGLFHIAMKTDEKNLISTSVSIFFGGNGIGFGKYGYGNKPIRTLSRKE